MLPFIGVDMMNYFRFLVLLLCLVIHSNAAEEKHFLDGKIQPAAKELWGMLGLPEEGDKDAGTPSCEDFTQMILRELKKLGPYPENAIKKLNNNQPLQSTKQVHSFIDTLLMPEDGKKKVKKWFADEEHSASEREAMRCLLYYIQRSPK